MIGWAWEGTTNGSAGCGVSDDEDRAREAAEAWLQANPQGTAVLQVIYVRAFESESQALLENFATFPFVHPHMWGANLRPVALLMGIPYMPAFSIVAYTWYGNYDVTNPALFIADETTSAFIPSE